MRIPLVVGAYTDEHRDVNNQACNNFIPAPAGPESKTGGVLKTTPGLYALGSPANKAVRAIIEFDGALYAVIGNVFYSVTYNKVAKTATYSAINTIHTSTGYLKWAANVDQIMMVDSRSYYVYTVSSGTFSINPDEDFLGARNVVFMDSYFIYNVPDTALVYATDVNDGTTISALDVTTAEFRNDNVVTVETYNGLLWILGERTIEVYQDTANAAGFPFSPMVGASINQGCGAADSVQIVDEMLVFLDDRGYFVGVKGFQFEVLGNEAIHEEIQSLDGFSDAYSMAYTEDGHTFYCCAVPKANKMYVFDVTTKLWHTRTSTQADLTQGIPRMISLLRFQNRNLVGDVNNGNIYEMSRDYLDENGITIHRKKITKNLNNNNLLFDVPHVGIDITSGLAPAGTTPYMQLRTSIDRGRSWDNVRILPVGQSGDYAKQVDDWCFGTSRNFQWEISIAEAIDIDIIDFIADVGTVENG